MDTSSLSGGLERFSKRKDVNKTLTDIADTTATFNMALSDTSNEYDSLVVFSHTEGAATAVPVATLEASDTNWYRHNFRKDNIDGRRVVLAGTALGKALAHEKHAGYANSAINPSATQMVFTERLIHEGRVVGAVQESFTPVRENGYLENLPGDRELHALSEEYREVLARTAAKVALLQSMSEGSGSLGLLLEREDPIAPDAFIVRTDVDGSRRLARGYQRRAYEAYQNQSQIFLRRLAEKYQERYLIDQYGVKTAYSDQGDGAYLILPLPGGYNPYDIHTLNSYHHYTATPFMNNVRAGLTIIGNRYLGDLTPEPTVQVSGAFGNIEENGVGRFVSTTMYELAEQKTK